MLEIFWIYCFFFWGWEIARTWSNNDFIVQKQIYLEQNHNYTCSSRSGDGDTKSKLCFWRCPSTTIWCKEPPSLAQTITSLSQMERRLRNTVSVSLKTVEHPCSCWISLRVEVSLGPWDRPLSGQLAGWAHGALRASHHHILHQAQEEQKDFQSQWLVPFEILKQNFLIPSFQLFLN